MICDQVVFLLHAHMLFHRFIVNIIDIRVYSLAVEYIFIQVFIKQPRMRLCNIKMPLLMTKDVFISNPSP